MLALRGRGLCALPSSASVGVAVLLGTLPSADGISCLLVLSSGYGKGPVGGGDVGAPNKAALLEAGTLYAAHCCVGSSGCGEPCLLILRGWGVGSMLL